MSQATVKFIKLQTEGKLQKGDVLLSSTRGEVTVAFIRPDMELCVRDNNNHYFNMKLDLPAGAKLVG